MKTNTFIFIIFLHLVYQKRTFHVKGDSPGDITWLECLRSCLKRGYRGISLGETKTQHENLVKFLIERNVSMIWLNSSKIIFEKMQQVNQQISDIGIKRKAESLVCGYYDLRGNFIRSTNCKSTEGTGFICQYVALFNCNQLYWNCIKHEGQFYSVNCSSSNWFEARNICLQNGGDLISLETLPDVIRSEWTTKCEHVQKFWVGLRESEWLMTTGNNCDESQYRWLPRQPGDTGECVQIFRAKSGTYGWKTVSCDETAPCLCEKNYRNIPVFQTTHAGYVMNQITEDNNKGVSEVEKPVVLEGSFGLLAFSLIVALVSLGLSGILSLMHFCLSKEFYRYVQRSVGPVREKDLHRFLLEPNCLNVLIFWHFGGNDSDEKIFHDFFTRLFGRIGCTEEVHKSAYAHIENGCVQVLKLFQYQTCQKLKSSITFWIVPGSVNLKQSGLPTERMDQLLDGCLSDGDYLEPKINNMRKIKEKLFHKILGANKQKKIHVILHIDCTPVEYPTIVSHTENDEYAETEYTPLLRKANSKGIKTSLLFINAAEKEGMCETDPHVKEVAKQLGVSRTDRTFLNSNADLLNVWDNVIFNSV